MAKRIVFMKKNTAAFNEEVEVEFTWAKGLNTICRQRSIHNLFDMAGKMYPSIRILDTSYVSDQQDGVKLSSYNLPITLASCETVPLECVYQGSKMIDNAGPYTDLFNVDPMKVKADSRLNGEVTGFRFEGEDYPAASTHSFYNWLFCRALHQNHELAEQLGKYDAFCDIMKPADAVECEARAAAIYEGLRISNKLAACLDSFDVFCEAMNGVDAETIEKAPKAPAVELFMEILASPGLCKLLASLGKTFGFSGSAKERTEATRKHLACAYHNAFQMGQLTPDCGGFVITVDGMVTINLVPNADYVGGWRLYFHTDKSQAHKNIASMPTPVKPELTPADYLKSRGFNVVSESTPEPESVIKLAQESLRTACGNEEGWSSERKLLSDELYQVHRAQFDQSQTVPSWRLA